MSLQFDVIVVGAGPAGIAASYLMAKAGLKVVVLERGEYPGSKNMFGGILYGKALGEILPEFLTEAPVERFVTNRKLTLLSHSSSVSIDYRNEETESSLEAGFIISRSRFDYWFAEKAVQAGALIVPECLVEGILTDGPKVIGVKVGREQGEVYAPLTIAADGVNSVVARQAGLRKMFPAEDLFVGVKEVLALPKSVIEDRFGLKGNQGAAVDFLGIPVTGLQGGGFIYTSRESLSVGIVVRLSSLRETKAQILQVLEEFKQHPAVSRFVQGGILKEYSAHLVPEGGFEGVPRVLKSGLLLTGDAAGLVLSTGLHREGMNLAIASGMLAAEAAKQAFLKEDFSENTLSLYHRRLLDSFVLKDLKTFHKASAFLANPRLYEFYPRLLCETARGIYEVDGNPKKKVFSTMREWVKRNGSFAEVARDVWRAWRAY